MNRHDKSKPFTNLLVMTAILGSGLLGFGAAFASLPVFVKMSKPPVKFSSFFHPPSSPGISPSPKRAQTPFASRSQKQSKGGSILNEAWRIHRAISTSA